MVQMCEMFRLSVPPHPSSCPPELKIFAGKRVISALAGRMARIIKPIDNSMSPKQLAELWKKMGYVVLLPSGEGMCWESSCHFELPLSPSPEHAGCSASAVDVL